MDKKTSDITKTKLEKKRKIIIQYTQNVVLKTGRVHAVFVMCSVPVMGEYSGQGEGDHWVRVHEGG